VVIYVIFLANYRLEVLWWDFANSEWYIGWRVPLGSQ